MQNFEFGSSGRGNYLLLPPTTEITLNFEVVIPVGCARETAGQPQFT
jgi:hypothetical protein